VPIVVSLQAIQFSLWILANVLILFILLSSILGLIWAGLQFFITKIFQNLKFKIQNSKLIINSTSKIQHPKFNIVPFFPAMIIAFWILAWKLSFFISLLFPLA